MNRRSFLASALFVPVLAQAAEQPWKAQLLIGPVESGLWQAGLRITMLPGWKTYWRVPGSAGIAPSIEVKGDNLKSLQVLYPMPERLKAGEDDVIGYKDEVLFPLLLEANDLAKPLSGTLKAFLGVCDEVCIPAQLATELNLDPTNPQVDNGPEIRRWLFKQPRPMQGFVKSASVSAAEDGKPALVLAFSNTVEDVFVEGKATHYFHAPTISGNSAMLKVSGAKSPDELKGQPLRLTVKTQNTGVEETVTVV